MTEVLAEAGHERPSFALSESARVLFACLSGAAGVIHFVMVPSHMNEWAVEGFAFALAGWFQLTVAYLALRRPTRALLRITLLANLAFVGVWVVSRTAGLPGGPHAGHAETVSIVDLTCVGLEVGLLATAALLLWRPQTTAAWAQGTKRLAAVVPLGILALTTLVITSESARNHAHGSHGDHAAAGSHEHGHGDGETADGHHHDGDDRGLAELTNGHHHEIVEHDLDSLTQARLDEQLALTRQVAATYPTVADAEGAGYRRAGPYSPGLGAHFIQFGGGQYLNGDGVVNRQDALSPLAIIYDGTEPDSEVAGFMYYSMSADEPAGFVGPNDVWHYHESICIKYGPGGEIDAPFGMDHEATAEQCASVGGSILPLTQWMVHVWSVPGWDNVDGGVFAEVNPALDCPDGTYHRLPPDRWAENPLNICRSAAV